MAGLVMNKGNFYGGFAADENTIYGFANELGVEEL